MEQSELGAKHVQEPTHLGLQPHEIKFNMQYGTGGKFMDTRVLPTSHQPQSVG